MNGLLNSEAVCVGVITASPAIDPMRPTAKNGGVKSNVFENVVVDAIIVNTKTSADNQFLIALNIVSETKARTKIVQILVPQVMVSLLHRTSSE